LKIEARALDPLIRAQAASISRWAVTAGEGSSRLGVLSGLSSFSLVDMLHGTGGRVWFLAVPFPPCGLPLLDYLLARTLVLFLSLSWVLSFSKVWQGSYYLTTSGASVSVQ